MASECALDLQQICRNLFRRWNFRARVEASKENEGHPNEVKKIN